MPEPMTTDPRTRYERERTLAAAEAAVWQRRETTLSRLRLVVFAIATILGWLAFGSHRVDPFWVVPPALLFIALLIVHDRVIRRHQRATRTVAFFEDGLGRLAGSFPGRSNRGERFRAHGHPYAEDLDLFGEKSLFELLCTTRTAGGESRLAHWLLEPASGSEARARQEAVAELRERVELRRDLALLGEEVGSAFSPKSLIAWGARSSNLAPRALAAMAAALTGLTLLGLLVWLRTRVGAVPFLFFASLQGGLALLVRGRVSPVLAGAAVPSHELGILAGLLERLEVETGSATRLAELRARLCSTGVPPSRRIAELRRLVDLLDARRNQFFAPIGALLMWGTQVACALERWRARSGTELGPWLDAASEMEALCSLAGYAYEHPNDVFAQIVDEGPLFDAQDLGHPLIPDAECVRNDVTLDGRPQALLMSGSNMSGKSTLLRSVGCACVLALAGAPVRARALRLSPLQVAASIRISDSLQQGASHFFAEITRLRLVVELAEAEMERPVLFLLDEILHGTNSHDRRIGAEAVMRGLVERGALGIVTTHDLALARIAEALAPRVENVHFEDQIEDGRMSFDYRLRPGVVTKSNAIALMRSVGLDV